MVLRFLKVLMCVECIVFSRALASMDHGNDFVV